MKFLLSVLRFLWTQIVPPLSRLAFAVVFAQGLTASLADHYHQPRPGYAVCLAVVLLLEIAGFVLRGGIGWLYTKPSQP